MTAIKVASFGSAVNVTLGLPFPRTSPDHGTALDIAGRGLADAGSMILENYNKFYKLTGCFNSFASTITGVVFSLKTQYFCSIKL